MIVLGASRLSYEIGDKVLLKDVSVTIQSGDKVGVVGVNGSGKTTLFRLLAGEISPSDGEIYLGRDKKIGFLHQNDAFQSGDFSGSGDETLFSRMISAFPDLLNTEKRLSDLEKRLSDPKADPSLAEEYAVLHARFVSDGGLEFRNRARSYLVRMGFEESRHNLPVSSLSGGERTRLSLARLLCREPDVLLLDEPTNHLDLATSEFLEKTLSSYKKTFVVISHDRYFLDRVTTRTLEVENGRVTSYNVPYTAYTEERKKDREAREKQYRLQQKEIERIEAFIDRMHRWNREKNIIAAESRQKALDRMVRVEKPDADPRSVSFRFSESEESGNEVLAVRNLTLGYGEKTVLSSLSFLLRKKERLFILGPNGCGKSTLVRALCGLLPPKGGFIEFGYRVRVGYYDQENQRLDENNTVLEELWSGYPNLTQTEIRSTLARFLFRGDTIEKTVSVLSGGERARLTIAKLMLSKVNLLILDEPTNHLDIPSREALEDALLAFDGTLVAVSHDRYFTNKLATRILAFRGFSAPYTDFLSVPGNYDDYLAAAETSSEASPKKPEEEGEGKKTYLLKKQRESSRRSRETRVEKNKAEMATIEARLSEIEKELSGEASTNYVRASELWEEQSRLEEKWMVLGEENESLRAQLSQDDDPKTKEPT
ncbi:MAG: ABC-F family ATP-binding cassette domain-containing protein [Clostridia bacterium]|nr:ABC-F family ATP-binding cassette domain-containing protein [Clostridia bacterium]